MNIQSIKNNNKLRGKTCRKLFSLFSHTLYERCVNFFFKNSPIARHYKLLIGVVYEEFKELYNWKSVLLSVSILKTGNLFSR